MPHISITYLILYSMTRAPLFLLFRNTRSNKVNDLWNKQKFSTTTIMMTYYIILSIMGLPPLTGFIPKLIVINTLTKHSTLTLIILITGSIINLFFYINVRLNTLTSNQQPSARIKTSSLPKPWGLTSTVALNLLALYMLILYALIIFIKPQRHRNNILYPGHLSRNCGNNNKNNYPHRISPARTIPK